MALKSPDSRNPSTNEYGSGQQGWGKHAWLKEDTNMFKTGCYPDI